MNDQLIQASKAAMENAYAPYSNFKVGAAVLASSGEIYGGCNVENVSFGLTICAERVAIGKAVSEGEREISAIAIANSKGMPAYPCGACRQMMIEFAPKSGDVTIYVVSNEGIETSTLAELMPNAFGLTK